MSIFKKTKQVISFEEILKGKIAGGGFGFPIPGVVKLRGLNQRCPKGYSPGQK